MFFVRQNAASTIESYRVVVRQAADARSVAGAGGAVPGAAARLPRAVRARAGARARARLGRRRASLPLHRYVSEWDWPASLTCAPLAVSEKWEWPDSFTYVACGD